MILEGRGGAAVVLEIKARNGCVPTSLGCYDNSVISTQIGVGAGDWVLVREWGMELGDVMEGRDGDGGFRREGGALDGGLVSGGGMGGVIWRCELDGEWDEG